MKKKILIIVMVLILILSNAPATQAEVIHYKKYKNFKYEHFDYKSIDIKYYTGKKSTVTIPEKIKGKKVRYVNLIRAKHLKKIKLSRYVKEVSLAGNRELLKVTVSKKNKYLSVKNNMVFNKKKTRLISVLGGYDKIIVPSNTKKIGSYSFYRSKLNKLTITKNVKEIEKSTFEDCKKLKDIIFEGDSIPKIGENAFGLQLDDISFYVKNDEVAQALLKELGDRFNLKVRIYVGNELLYEKQIVKSDKYYY